MSNLKRLFGLTASGSTANPTLYRYNRYMQPVINVSKDALALDHSQIFLGASVWDNGTEWRGLYTGQSADTIGSYTNVDQMFLFYKTKSNDVRTGWTKLLGVDGKPKTVFQPSFIDGRFDEAQVWMRSVIKVGSTLHGWYTGDGGAGSTAPYYRIGYATSTDDGETWTRYSTSEVYSDGLTDNYGIVVFTVLKDDTNYKAFYTGREPNDGLCLAESSDGITWTKTATLFAGLEYGFPWEFKKYGSNYFLWIQRQFRTPSNYGPAKRIFLLTSTDLTNWTFLGDQLTITGSNEFGISGPTILQKPNGEFFCLLSNATNKIEAIAASTDEPFTNIKIAELNRTDLPIANAYNTFDYPDYVQWHAPLGIDTGFTEVISLGGGSISGHVDYAGLQFVKMSGSQVITFSGISINTSSFCFKMAISIVTTGTLELFRIGNDILVTLESGKLRVRLSPDGAGYDKDYITTVNISKPTGITYIDNHIYIAFSFIGGVLKMYNDFVEFTSGQITKTVDTAMTDINNSQSNILIGQNAAIEVRSVSILSGATDQELIDLDI